MKERSILTGTQYNSTKEKIMNPNQENPMHAISDPRQYNYISSILRSARDLCRIPCFFSLIRIFISIYVVTGIAYAASSSDGISLAGEWRFQFDPNKVGEQQNWQSNALTGTIPLPGTTETAGLGEESKHKDPARLSRVRPFEGLAWYQRDIEIPQDWKDKRVSLFLESTRITKVWLNDKELGTYNSLVAPHVYQLGETATPGKHRITIMVRNFGYPPIGDSHQISNNTQTNWNGILGKIELRATDHVWIESARPFADVTQKLLNIKIRLGQQLGGVIDGKVSVSATVANSNKKTSVAPVTKSLEKFNVKDELEVTLPLGAEAQTWDEFSPVFYNVEVNVSGMADGKPFNSKCQIPAALRDFNAKGKQFKVNGKTIFLRGKHDACVFPLTGHAPMEKEGWLKVMRISQEYGINHYRFHGWCPPRAAFEAADELGIYVQAELPNWAPFEGKPEHDDYLLEEGRRIVKTFGNHPSFTMFSLGNELTGKREIMASVVKQLRDIEPRILYAQGSNNYWGNPTQAPGDDFWVSMRSKSGKYMLRGSYSHGDKPLGRIQSGPADTLADFSEAVEISTIPIISHETGQYAVFPDLKEIPKYTGVVQARNFEIVRDRLQEKGMLDQADDFFRASGRLSAICYKAENEMALRTPLMAGFQLLDLQDFPGQGTALIGILNAFMESKGVMTAEEWKQSCSASTLLLRFPSYVWTADQTFKSEVALSHYGKSDIANAVTKWMLRDESGNVINKGELSPKHVSQGALTTLGSLEFGFDSVKKVPARLNLEVKLADGSSSNSYPLWVYPAKNENSLADVTICRNLDSKAITKLKQGGSVVLLLGSEKGKVNTPTMFASDFWCWAMWPIKPPGSCGLLMDPKHPALAEFPTEFHSNWQWFDICNSGWPLVLDDMPAGYRPIVQVIDNFTRCRRLGLISEFKCAGGKLIVVGCDLEKLGKNTPAAKQLLKSVISYAQSKKFNPEFEMPEAIKTEISYENVALGKKTKATSTHSEKMSAAYAVDEDDQTFWLAADGEGGYSWQVDLGEAQDISKCEMKFESDGKYLYLLESSTDGENWKVIVDNSNENEAKTTHVYDVAEKRIRYLRVTFMKQHGRWASMREFKAYKSSVN